MWETCKAAHQSNSGSIPHAWNEQSIKDRHNESILNLARFKYEPWLDSACCITGRTSKIEVRIKVNLNMVELSRKKVEADVYVRLQRAMNLTMSFRLKRTAKAAIL